MFDIDFFLKDQAPFYDFVRTELYPNNATLPTTFHHFMRLLHEKNMLTRVYTQNIDMLERMAGIPQESICECHGTQATASCGKCKRDVDGYQTMRSIRKGEMPKCEKCSGPLKPDIVFFGEKMPRQVVEQMKMNMPDMRKCDLLIVAGTSLAVQPFASFIDAVPKSTPRIFINRAMDGSGRNGEYDDLGGQHMWGKCGNYRDVLLRGDSDKVVTKLCKVRAIESRSDKPHNCIRSDNLQNITSREAVYLTRHFAVHASSFARCRSWDGFRSSRSR